MAAIPWRQIDLSTLQDLCRDCVRTETTVLQSIFSATSQRQTTSPIQDGTIKDNRYVKICKYLQQSRFCWRISPWKGLAMVIISGRKKIIFFTKSKMTRGRCARETCSALPYQISWTSLTSVWRYHDFSRFYSDVQKPAEWQHGITNVVKLRDK